MSGSMIANRQDFVQGPDKLSEVVCAVRQTFSSGVRSLSIRSSMTFDGIRPFLRSLFDGNSP